MSIVHHCTVTESPGLNCRNNPNVCTGGSYCRGGYCVCPEGYDEQNGECVIPKILVEPGKSCDRPVNTLAQVECIGNSVCANGYCVCPNGEPIQNGMCVTLNSVGEWGGVRSGALSSNPHGPSASPGEPCVNNVTRCLGNSVCLNGCTENRRIASLCIPYGLTHLLCFSLCLRHPSSATERAVCNAQRGHANA